MDNLNSVLFWIVVVKDKIFFFIYLLICFIVCSVFDIRINDKMVQGSPSEELDPAIIDGIENLFSLL